jgi:DNA-binding NarL/FixJ family response regulator
MERCRGHAAAAMTEKERTSILIAEGEATARRALRQYLGAQPGLDVVAEAADDGSLLEGVEGTCPDLVLLEWHLPGRPKADLIAALQNREPQPLVVVYGNQPESSSPAMDAGADVFVHKGQGPRQLLNAIRWLVLEARYAQPPHRHDL